MVFDYSYLSYLSSHHAAWRLLQSPHAPLIIGFLRRVYIEPVVRQMPASTLAILLGDELHAINQLSGDPAFPKQPSDYLNDWAEKDWLRKFYTPNSDEPHFDVTPAAESAVRWACALDERTFIGTESRLLTFVALLKQMAEGTDTDKERRLAVLRKQRGEIDEKIAKVARGEIDLLSESEVRDRFQQVAQLSHDLLSDFRQVEQNFRKLSRDARERIALWDRSKGALLESLWQSRDEIQESDQGNSFNAFFEFLLSVSRQEELSLLLANVLQLPALKSEEKGNRMDRVHYDWLAAAENTHQTVAELSHQVRRFLDDQARLENPYIMKIVQDIEGKTLALRNQLPAGNFAEIDEMACAIELPMERPLYRPQVKPELSERPLEHGQAEGSAEALYDQVVVNRARLTHHIDALIQQRGDVTLLELVDAQPLENGLAELVAYLDLGSSRYRSEVIEFLTDYVTWKRGYRIADEADEILERRVALPRVVFRGEA